MKHWLWSIIALFSLLTAAAGPYVVREGDDWRKIRFDVTKIREGSILDFGKALNPPSRRKIRLSEGRRGSLRV